MRLQDNREVEFKLSVTGGDPDAFLDEVSRLPALAGLILGPPADHLLHDTYWELGDNVLRARKLSLRLRRIDDHLVFTVKGGTSSSHGLFSRYELEVPVTPANWLDVHAVLVSEGADLGPARTDGQPTAWLAAAGLHLTQDRTTRRTVRYAFPATDDAESIAEPIAEMALDRTRFDFGTISVEYREIEIEQLRGDEAVPRALGTALLERFPDRLEWSTMGKYSRGLAIERGLRAAGRL